MQFNLADLFEAHADAFPDRLGMVCGDVHVTYGELDRRASQLAHYWLAAGVRPGDHIGLYLYNRREYVECMLAAWKIRARTINVNYRYVAHELAYIFDNADMVGVVYEPELRAEVEAARTDAMVHNLAVGAEYEAALAGQPDDRAGFPPRSADDLVIIYTGGTTGMPRGVMWRHEDLFFAALQGGNPGGEPITEAAALTPRVHANGGGINVLGAPPLIHGSAQLATWIALLNGGVAGIVPGRHFDVEAILDLCEREEMHTLNIVGDAMAIPLADALEANPGRWTLRHLLVIASAGAVLSASAREKLEALLPNAMCLNNFGASETGHQGAAFYDDGKPVWIMDERHTVVLDDDLQVIAPGSDTVGTLARFGHIPLGYYGDADKTARVFRTAPDGTRYVVNGDKARVAADGTVEFLGRGSVCINSGGEKVYAEEVEEALKAHPHVFDAIVVGVPDRRWGKRVEACVTARVGAPDVEDILAHARTQIAGYKVPKRIHVVGDLHRHPSGKPNYAWALAHAASVPGDG